VIAGRLDCGLPRLREPRLERTETICLSEVLVRMKAPLKRAQSRRFAILLVLFILKTRHSSVPYSSPPASSLAQAPVQPNFSQLSVRQRDAAFTDWFHA